MVEVYNNTLDAVKYINKSDLEYIDKLCKIDNILHRGFAKINNTIVIVDEYGILD